MAYAFKTPPANPSFGAYNESIQAGNYVLNKKARVTFCNANVCPGGPVVQTQGEYLLLNQAKLLNTYCRTIPFNKTNLNINLVSIFNSQGCCNIKSNKTTPSTPAKCPTNIPYQPTSTTPFYQTYTIDPSGCLFGISVCTANNYLQNLTYNPPPYSNVA